MKRSLLVVVVVVALVLAVSASGAVKMLAVPAGTDVVLVFDQALSSKTAKVGQSVALHVKDKVVIGGKTVIKAGRKATGVISSVSKRKRYGINAKMQIALNPIKSVYGASIPVQPRTKGKAVSGKKSAQAGAATVGGAIVLGPVGLAGGYFIHGKSVNIKPGDVLVSEVSKDTVLTLNRTHSR